MIPPSILEEFFKKLVGEARTKQGRNYTHSFLIVGTQSVKNTNTAENKGYDGGKWNGHLRGSKNADASGKIVKKSIQVYILRISLLLICY